MKYIFGAWVVGMSLFIALPSLVAAAIPDTYTNDNFFDSEHDKPVSFWQDSTGNFYGTTLTGKNFSQITIENSLSIRLMKFSIDEAFFYVSDKGIIVAQSDIEALSIYLTKSV